MRFLFTAVLAIAVALMATACGGLGSAGSELEGIETTDELHWTDADGNRCKPNDTFVPLDEPIAETFLRTGSCLTFDGRDIGRPDLSGEVATISVMIDKWFEAEGRRHDYVGFSFVSTDAIDFVVQAEDGLYVGSGDGWIHPSGTGAAAIISVSFCAEIPSDLPEPGCDDTGCCEVTVHTPPVWAATWEHSWRQFGDVQPKAKVSYADELGDGDGAHYLW